MGNILGRREATVMKLNRGRIFKVKLPARVRDVIKKHPGHVLLDYDDHEQFGLQSIPLEPQQELECKFYILASLQELLPPRTEDRLEFMMIAKSTAPIGQFLKIEIPVPEAQRDKLKEALNRHGVIISLYKGTNAGEGGA